MRRWLAMGMGGGSLAILFYLARIDVSSNLIVDVLSLVAFTAPSLIGGYLAWRVPDNPVGLVLAGFGFSFLLGVAGETAAGTDSVLGPWGAWFGSWQWALALVLLLVFLPLLFPTGRVPARRRKWIVPVSLLGLALLIFANAFRRSIELGDGGSLVSPVSLPFSNRVYDLSGIVGLVLVLTSVVGALVTAIRRYRRSTGIERQQMRVFAGAMLFAVLGSAFNLLAYEAGLEDLANSIFALLVVVVMVAIAVAVLRYRLYDLGRLVSRTVSYALVAVVVGGTYAATVFTVASLAVDSSNSLSVAMATLAAAGVFRPVLTRVRRFVDKRFAREKYDAQRTIDHFGARLRLETNLDELTHNLATVVHSTMRPERLNVWLAE